VNTDTGELNEARLEHKEQAERFYRELSQRGVTVGWAWKPVGIRAGSSAC
jgi:hypothetical protein